MKEIEKEYMEACHQWAEQHWVPWFLSEHKETSWHKKKRDPNLFYRPPFFPKPKEAYFQEIREKMHAKTKQYIEINREIKTLDDLLRLCDDYPDCGSGGDDDVNSNVEYNIQMKTLHRIKQPLTELNRMVGLQSIKTNVLDQILYFLQGFHQIPNNQQSNPSGTAGGSSEYMHTVIYGPPGTGKTEVAKLMGQIFSQMGVLTKGVFKKVVRSDLVAGYLGQTAIKTRDVIKECLGGCLFIDEAYSLGNTEKKDSFSKECLDTLCEALSDHRGELMVIIAGYEQELHDCFFSYNRGLESRFIWRFHTEAYTGAELCAIFKKKMADAGWSFLEDEGETQRVAWFEANHDYFPYHGRDVEALLTKVKIEHSKRLFGRPKEERTRISLADMEYGFLSYKKNEACQKQKQEAEKKRALSSMYI